MTLLIKNGGYAILIWLGLMLSMSVWKEFILLQILNDLSVKRLIKGQQGFWPGTYPSYRPPLFDNRILL